MVGSIERQLKIQGLKINWVPVTVQSRFDAVAKGRADMECGSSTITLTRLKQVDFSNVTFVETTGLLAKKDAGLRSLSDLSDKKIAVIGGTTNQRAIEAQVKRRLLSAAVVPFGSREEAIAALEEGKVDAFASDRLLLIGAAVKAKDPERADAARRPPFVRALRHRAAAGRHRAAPRGEHRPRAALREPRDRRDLPPLVRPVRPRRRRSSRRSTSSARSRSKKT